MRSDNIYLLFSQSRSSASWTVVRRVRESAPNLARAGYFPHEISS